MGVFSFFGRVKNFFMGLAFFVLGPAGIWGIIESGSDLAEPPALYLTISIGVGAAIYGLILMKKSLGKNGDKDFDKSERKKKSNNKTQTVMKVWRMRYTGTHEAAPSFLDVPSANQTGRPTGKEIEAALLKMGYDSAKANAIANGGSDRCWKVEK